MKQCPSCGGDCGYTKKTGCEYNRDTRITAVRGLLTKKEMADIQNIVFKWDYALEAAIEAYLLGIHRCDKARAVE